MWTEPDVHGGTIPSIIPQQHQKTSDAAGKALLFGKQGWGP